MMVSGKLVCLPTQLYDVLSGRVGKNYVSNLAAENYGIRAQKWNAEWAIVFQMVILLHDNSSLATNIFSCELMPESLLGVVDRLTKSFETPTPQIKDTWGGIVGLKCITTSSYIFKPCSTWKIARGSQIYFWTGNKGGFATPKNGIIKMVVMDETVASVLAGKNHTKKFPLFYVGGLQRRT